MDLCIFPEPFYDCDGNCLNDLNENGICDELEVEGCMDPGACTYNPEANVNDVEACTYAAEFEDCDGNCLNDVNDNNICDELEEQGCTDETAINFNPDATLDDGSCVEACDMPSLNFTPSDCTDRGFVVTIDVMEAGDLGVYIITNNINDAVVFIDGVGTYVSSVFDRTAQVVFDVRAVDFETCFMQSEVVECATMSINEENDLAFELYPNPAVEYFTLRSGSEGTFVVTVYDLYGKVVHLEEGQPQANGLRINIAHLASGTYMVQLRSRSEMATRKLIIQR
jgi:hypothetical protein